MDRDNGIVYGILKFFDGSQKQEEDKKQLDLYVQVVINIAMTLNSY
jgi:hypothetical protein